MNLLAVSVGRPREISWQDRVVNTSIFKTPVEGRIRVSRLNLDGDEQSDLLVHGGPDKAVCVYSMDHYPFWRRELEIEECGPGWFGENFSIEGQTETQVAIGDTYEIGSAVVQISQPRSPCWKLGRRWKRLDMPKLVVHSGRTGWYLRVIETGQVESGDVLTPVERPFPHLTVDAVNAAAYSRGGATNIDAVRELANCPALAQAWRGKFRNLVE